MTTLIFIENVLGSGQAVKLTEDFGDYSVVRDLRPGEHARLVVSLFKTITVEEVALGGRLYEDMDEATLTRECPPRYLPINGAALATAGRVGAMSYSRSAADLCVDA